MNLWQNHSILMADLLRREVILEAADRLLRHYGPQKTTMADVAREANVGVGSVYLEFPSKDALVEALSRRRHHAVLDAMREAAEQAGPRAADRLTRMLTARAAGFVAMAEAGAHACDLLHCGSEAVKAAQGAYVDEERALLGEVLRAGVEGGELEAADLDATLRALLRAYASFAPPWVFKMDAKSLEVDLAAMHALVLHGLLKRNGSKKRG
jgi:AcrR family transcriptional regulator